MDGIFSKMLEVQMGQITRLGLAKQNLVVA